MHLIKKSKAFSLGGTRYTKADFDLEKISYVIRNDIPYIKSNGGIKPYYEIEEIFNSEDKINIKPTDNNNSEWYEDDPDFKTRDDYMIKITNWPYDLLQKYYDNFSSKEKAKNNSQFYADELIMHHEKNIISKQEALDRDYNEFIKNNIQSYQILVKPSTMITYHYDEIDIVKVPVMYYVTNINGDRSKFELNITAVLNKDNTKIHAIGKNITVDNLSSIIRSFDNNSTPEKSPNYIERLSHGQSPYSYCYGDKNECNDSCSKISVTASNNSDVIVLVKKDDNVFRNAFISKGRTYEFNLPNGTYQTFFYYGSDWNNEKYMKETSCGSLYGGFRKGEHFGKDSPQFLYNNILTYELILQQNGNFSTKSSNLNEAF